MYIDTLISQNPRPRPSPSQSQSQHTDISYIKHSKGISTPAVVCSSEKAFVVVEIAPPIYYKLHRLNCRTKREKAQVKDEPNEERQVD